MTEQLRSLSWWPALYEPFHNLGARIADRFAPPSEAADEDDVYVLNVELPGVALEDVDVTVAEDVMTISGEKTSKRADASGGYLFSEIRYGAFRRSFQLPPSADPNNVEAEMKDGVATLRIAKRDAATPARSIPIRS